MRVIKGKRGSGKTTKLVATAQLTGYPIVVGTQAHQKYILEMAEEQGYDIECYTMNSLPKSVEGVLIDDYDLLAYQVLRDRLGCFIIGGTVTE